MTSPDQNTGMPRRHVVGLSLIAAIAVVLVASKPPPGALLPA